MKKLLIVSVLSSVFYSVSWAETLIQAAPVEAVMPVITAESAVAETPVAAPALLADPVVEEAPAAPKTAAPEHARSTNPADPWENTNRKIFKFNDRADRAIFKPIAKTYKNYTPPTVQSGLTNFFSNLRTPWVMINNLLQGKVKAAGQDGLRFLTNTLLGFAGFRDVAGHLKVPKNDEDFGQTLGVWGMPAGPYMVLPLMGPSTVRDTLGLGADIVSNPRRYYLQTGSDVSLVAVELISRRASLLDVEGIIQGDRYLFIRDLYLQRRAYAVLDGKVESDPFLDDSSDEEDTPAVAPSTPEPALESTPPADAVPSNSVH